MKERATCLVQVLSATRCGIRFFYERSEKRDDWYEIESKREWNQIFLPSRVSEYLFENNSIVLQCGEICTNESWIDITNLKSEVDQFFVQRLIEIE